MTEEAFASVINNGRPWKLSGLQVIEIYRRAWKPGANQSLIGREFGLKPSTVSVIKYGKQTGYREIIDVAKRIGLLKTAPDPIETPDDAPEQKSKLFHGHPAGSILRHALVRG